MFITYTFIANGKRVVNYSTHRTTTLSSGMDPRISDVYSVVYARSKVKTINLTLTINFLKNSNSLKSSSVHKYTV